MGKTRSQTGLEGMMLAGAFLIAILFVTAQTQSGFQDLSQGRAEQSLQDLANSIHLVRVQGNGASQKVQVFIPDNVVPGQTRFENGLITLSLEDKGEVKQITVPVDGCVTGELPTQPGLHEIVVLGGPCATVGSDLFRIEPARISFWLKPGETATQLIMLSSEKPLSASVQADPAIAGVVDLDLSQFGPQSVREIDAPAGFPISITAPLGASEGTITGSIRVTSSRGVHVIPFDLTIYSSSLELYTYPDASRTQESDMFYFNQPLYYRTVSKRNGQLSSTRINVTFTDPWGTVIDQGILDTTTGVLESSVASHGDIGPHTIIVHDLSTGEVRSKVLQAVKPIAWRVVFDTTTFAPRFASNDTTGTIRFQLLDQLGRPVQGLIFNTTQDVFNLGSEGWRYAQRSCNGADACTPNECPVSGDVNNWESYWYEDYWWPETSLPHNEDNWTTLDSTRIYRKHFTLTNTDRIESINVNYQCDEGCMCYINGELLQNTTLCQTEYPPQMHTWTRSDADFLSKLKEGDNVIACRVVEKKYTQTEFRYFDAGLRVNYVSNGGISLKRVVASAPSLSSYLSISSQGDWYTASFDPSELATISQGGLGNYIIYVDTLYNNYTAMNTVTFNIGTSLSSTVGYRIWMEYPNAPNINHTGGVDVKLKVLGQTGLEITNHKVNINVADALTGNSLKSCDLSAAGGDGYYHCFVPQTSFYVGKTYHVIAKDKDVKPQGLVHKSTFNIVTTG